MRYKRGDKVKCIYAGGIDRLTLNKTYTILHDEYFFGPTKARGSFVNILDDNKMEGNYISDRFVLINDIFSDELFQL